MKTNSKYLYMGNSNNQDYFIAAPGIYRIECWGARGYDYKYGGCGGYVAGTITLNEMKEL